MFLMHYDGMDKKGGSIYSYLDAFRNNYPNKYLDAFKKAVEINQKALYSNY
jgi:hypothetical protein